MTSNNELLLRVNGIYPAFGIEFGFASPRADEVRAADPYRQANVSFSIVQRREGRPVRHTLVDVGMGVVPSLLEFEDSHDVHVVHEVFLTHPHLDHFGQLDWLSMCLVRNGRPDQPRPLPIYATEACWQQGPNRVHRYLAERSDFRPLTPDTAIALDDLAITPFAVDHGPKAPGAVGFVLEWHGRKIILSGDFLRIPDEDHPRFRDADAVFLDTNTWHPADWTSHHSLLGNLRLIEKWRPKTAWLLHYSGYEDREHPNDRVSGPMSRQQFREELDRVRGAFEIRLADHGMLLQWGV